MAGRREPRQERNPFGQFEWMRRRLIIYVALSFCLVAAFALHVAALLGMDSTLLNTLTTANYALAGTTITAYVFAAVVDDKSARETAVAVEVAAATPASGGVTVTTAAPEGESE